MKHAFFDHTAHQMLICAECHTRATTSQKSSDVMIPGIDTCRKCHHSGTDSAESRIASNVICITIERNPD